MLKKHIAETKQYIKEVLEVVGKKLSVTDRTIKQVVEKALAEGIFKYSQVKKYSKVLMGKTESKYTYFRQKIAKKVNEDSRKVKNLAF